jgi:hypothetical protein
MKKKPSKKVFVVWLSNTTDRQDDEPIKVKASSKEEAKDIAWNYSSNRFTIRNVFTLKEFREFDPGWSALIRFSKVHTY